MVDNTSMSLALCALLIQVILKGLTLQKFVFDVCGYMYHVLFYVYMGTSFVD